MPLTLEERERRAYIEGRTGEAALPSLAIDTENDAIDEMRHERDMARESEDVVTRENDTLRDALERADEWVLTLTSELENAQDEVAGLRHENGQLQTAVDLL